MDPRTYQVVLRVETLEAKWGVLFELFKWARSAARPLPGFVGARLLAEQEDQNMLHLECEWASRCSLEAYLRSRQFTDLLAGTEGVSTSLSIRTAMIEQRGLQYIEGLRMRTDRPGVTGMPGASS